MDVAPVFTNAAPTAFTKGETAAAESTNVATVKRFYDIADGRIRDDLTELFTQDVQIYAPKFGTAVGLESMKAAGAGHARLSRMRHHVGEFTIHEIGDRVIVEGTTEGETVTVDPGTGDQTFLGGSARYSTFGVAAFESRAPTSTRTLVTRTPIATHIPRLRMRQ